EHLRTSQLIRREARTLALTLVDRYQEKDPERYHQAAWAVVRQRYLNPFQYRFALRQAETACRLAPDRGKYLTTLGVAQYRVADYRSALKTLARADQFNKGTPADLAFLALTHHQLGEKGPARDTLARLRELLKPGAGANEESLAFRCEAESVIAD